MTPMLLFRSELRSVIGPCTQLVVGEGPDLRKMHLSSSAWSGDI